MRQGSGFAETLLKKRHPSEFRHVLDPEERAARQDARAITRYVDNLMATSIEIPEKPELGR